MKENFLKVLLIMIAAGITVPLLFSLFPTNSNRSSSISDAIKITNNKPAPSPAPDGWITFTDKETGVHVYYPASYRVNLSGISGPATTEGTRSILTLDTFPSDYLGGTDEPFDGMALYLVPWQGELEELIEQEKELLVQNSQMFTGENRDFPGTTTAVTYAGRDGFRLDGYSWYGSIVRIYLPIEGTNHVLAVGINEKTPGSFMPQAEAILNTMQVD